MKRFGIATGPCLDQSCQIGRIQSIPTHIEKHSAGYTIIELMLVLTIVGILLHVAGISYSSYREKILNQKVIVDISNLELSIDAYQAENGSYPETLGDLQEGTYIDRWGNPYQYLRIEDSDDVKGHGHGKGKQRRDRNLNPINTDYDLYSMGKDGKTATELNSQKGRDDIVRALNGEFIGVASDF